MPVSERDNPAYMMVAGSILAVLVIGSVIAMLLYSLLHAF